MAAKVFISWSGDLSKALGEAIKDWIPKVLQSVKPYFTPDDIEKGSRWAKEIAHELATSQLGIICLTQENQNSSWILFEAGALSKNLDESKVCPILFNLDSTDLVGPLSSFQATKFNKSDFKKLIESINNSCNETKLDSNSLDETFDMWWPRLDNQIQEILSQDKTSTKPKKRSERDILEELLEIARSNAKSILSETRSISRYTAEDLVGCYWRIKEILAQGGNMELVLPQMEHIIIRLCKECNFEDVYFRRSRMRLSGMGKDMYRDKICDREQNPLLFKRKSEDISDLEEKG